jgi:hypothetical protein
MGVAAGAEQVGQFFDRLLHDSSTSQGTLPTGGIMLIEARSFREASPQRHDQSFYTLTGPSGFDSHYAPRQAASITRLPPRQTPFRLIVGHCLVEDPTYD